MKRYAVVGLGNACASRSCYPSIHATDKVMISPLYPVTRIHQMATSSERRTVFTH